ncbi:hypothetical protein MNB_SM-4-230 [hydrothermal vent metagenome]|uniref:ABC-type transport auxiliary lipoprotein component domain-containing protein n=1 Tax=hydrothermal vent metagenome TaxID=652676 RepID=A0A1W1C530_9ZZZZ
MKIVLMFLTLFMSACTVTQPHVSEYTLAPKIDVLEHMAKQCRLRSLKVGQVFSSNVLMSQKMKYIQSEYQESSFTQSEWARTPNKAISDALVKSVRSSALFANTNTYKSRIKTDLLLETHVEKFMQYFEQENEKSYVEVVLTLNLLSTKDSKSLSYATFSTRVDTESVDAKGGVIALNQALSRVLLETNIWLNGVCK